jgi:hypothetical protein
VINHLEQDPLEEMLATLCSYEDLFGPYHSQTLHLEAVIAIECWKRGDVVLARPLLERSVRYLAKHLGRYHDMRLAAIAALRDLLLKQEDLDGAGVLQKELSECQDHRLGSDHPDAIAARTRLYRILLGEPAL